LTERVRRETIAPVAVETRAGSRVERWARYAPLTGVVAVVLWVIGVVINEVVGDSPDDDAPAQEFAAYFEDETGSIFGGFFFFALGTLFFLWFLGSLRAALARAEGGVARLASLAFGAGVATAIFILGVVVPEVAGAIAADQSDRDLSPQAAEALFHLGIGFFVAAEFVTTVLFVATAVVILRTRIFPLWLAWASVVLAIALLVFPIGWIVLIFGLPLWTLVVSFLLYQRGEALEPEAAEIRARAAATGP
jgi:hypothetical protein